LKSKVSLEVYQQLPTQTSLSLRQLGSLGMLQPPSLSLPELSPPTNDYGRPIVLPELRDILHLDWCPIVFPDEGLKIGEQGS